MSLTLAPTCKACGFADGLLSPERRTRYDARILAALDTWAGAHLDARPLGELWRARGIAELLVAADQGLCVHCSEQLERPS